MAAPADLAPRQGLRGRFLDLVSSARFQSFAARFPLTRPFVRREGEALFDLVQGFVASQVLAALVELRICHRLANAPEDAATLGAATGIPADRMQRLLQAGAALNLLRRRRDGRFDLTPRGAALISVPGLEDMIAHHDVLYRDLADPVAFLRGETETELAHVWPYVFGAGRAEDPALARRYSHLMAESQRLVAEDTLAAAPLKGVRHLLDVGGGTGVFAEAAADRHPELRVTLLDLPQVVDAAQDRLSRSPVASRIACTPGSFRDDDLPNGADAISLIRVLYDHRDETVRALLARVHDALPPGGKLLVSEPMSGGARPDRAGDVYYALYTMAMRTGTVRSAEQIAALCRKAGFTRISTPRPHRPFVTRVLLAHRE
ncbi:SAM-dependent methlyltransferase [Roseivivax halodurans JCM 10272]|uniref:SAM-dependent methlyltransferase n=1 Tax=Roseivivax halodurans JCM 10272 TaxID=1449350 RepID=X7EIR6_9RHOB|nr:methyltransferase [Roseivivax halodurans]ETX15797.1 SAM-dependent methlyltransferase [Roseivivax halodurans JCM 10272]